MQKLEQYREISKTYDVGSELPSFITKIIRQREALAEVRQELEDIPGVDLNADNLQEQYKAHAHALALRIGARQIPHDKFEADLDRRLSNAVDVGFNRLIKTLKEKVDQDLASLEDSALNRLFLLTENLPNKLDTGLVPSTSRLMAVVKIEGPYKSLVSASAREFDKAARSNRREALKSVVEYPFASLVFVDSLDDLEQRRKNLADLLAPVGV